MFNRSSGLILAAVGIVLVSFFSDPASARPQISNDSPRPFNSDNDPAASSNLDEINGDAQRLYAGDVSQNDIEEIELVVSGGIYGWRLRKGRFYFDNNGTGEVLKILPVR